jgi:hypothetical protein
VTGIAAIRIIAHRLSEQPAQRWPMRKALLAWNLARCCFLRETIVMGSTNAAPPSSTCPSTWSVTPIHNFIVAGDDCSILLHR